MDVSLSYDGTTLTETIVDPTANASATETYTINIPATVGGSTAYIGFTAGTGGATAIQNVLTWKYSLASASTAVLDFSAGFANSASALTLNGAAVNGADLELTNGGGGEASSAFSTSAINITHFTTQFTLLLTGSANTADGFTFCIQGVGASAVGAGGGDLGFGGINNSVALKFDLYDNNGEGTDSTGLFTDGADPFNVGSVNLTNTGINLHSGDPMNVSLSYDGTTLTETIIDPVANVTATESYTIDIPSTVGGNTAYVGFTAGTGGLTSTQYITSWAYTPTTVSPNAPSGLGATPATATSISLTWSSNSTNQTGFHLDRATDAAFTQNLITETLPGSPNSFTDTATGLAPGNTYYYRIRAFNTAGDSANSNVASVTIPSAPPKPTDQEITDVTTTEIDIQWQDNAGHAANGYYILRSVNQGAFTQYASLPPTSRTAPSEYYWSDTNLTPGDYYEYHIVAYNTSGNNDFAGVNATTITSPPTSLAAMTSGNNIDLSWTAPYDFGATTYNIYRSTTSGGESGDMIASGVTGTTYADTTALGGVAYYYEVTAVNANAGYTPPLPSESAFSNEAEAAVPYPAPAQWAATAAASWNTIGDWINAATSDVVAPPGLRGVTGDTVLFGAAGGSPVTLDGASPSVAAIAFDNATSSYTIAQGSGGTLQLNNGANAATISVMHGSHTISAPVLLNSNLSIAPAAGTTLTISGAIGGTSESLTVNNSGTVILSGTNSYDGGTNVSLGNLIVTNPASLLDGSNLTVGNTALFSAVTPAAPAASAENAATTASPAAASSAKPTLPAAAPVSAGPPIFVPPAVQSVLQRHGAASLSWFALLRGASSPDGPGETKERSIQALERGAGQLRRVMLFPSLAAE